MQKSYIEFMREISDDELYKGLLAFGMFSEKLPPIFSSVKFFDYCKTANAFAKRRQLIQYEAMRNTNIPRLLAIPNPFAYQRLCKCLADNWDKLCTHFAEQTHGHTYKVSRIHIRKMIEGEYIFWNDYESFLGMVFKDAIFAMNARDWRIDGNPELDLLIGKRWIVKADIATCFPSIYTHSLPWALVGKPTAKQNRGDREWYNQIDKCCQNVKDGETHGIPIGPHASNLLSEVILTVIDKRLAKKWKYVRKIDDYTCYVKNRDEAETFITELSEELRQFDLLLNHRKTEILELPIAAVEHWTRQMEHISLHERNGKLNYKSVQAYLDSAVELMSENGMNASILNYAIKVLSKQEMSDNAKNHCVKTILHLAAIYPYLVPLLDRYVFERYSVSKDEIKEFTKLILEDALRLKNYETASFCIYFALKYNFELSALDANCGTESMNCVFMTLLHCYSEKCFDQQEKKKIKEYAKTLNSDETEFERNWLFCYECLPKSLLKDEWKPLKEAGVSFINHSF